MRIAPLDRSHLSDAELVLADACAFDRATDVAEEKLFAPGPAALPKPGPDNAFDPTLVIPALPFGAWEGDRLVGVASVSGRWLRLIAVVPPARRKGTGSALLVACEDAARDAGETRLRTLDQPGNYLAPGIDERNTDAIGWLERRGYARSGDPRCNVLIDVRTNPRVTAERAAELARAAALKGYVVRRARPDETALLDAVAKEFGGAWPFELQRALGHDPAGVHVVVLAGAAQITASPSGPSLAPGAAASTSAPSSNEPASVPAAGSAGITLAPSSTKPTGVPAAGSQPATSSNAPANVPAAGSQPATSSNAPANVPAAGSHAASVAGETYCAFAAHDGNNRGIAWFGPTGTWPAHRGKGLGEAVLLACLVDVGRDHGRCEVAWIGPRPFYEKVAGIVDERRFILLARDL